VQARCGCIGPRVGLGAGASGVRRYMHGQGLNGAAWEACGVTEEQRVARDGAANSLRGDMPPHCGGGRSREISAAGYGDAAACGLTHMCI
jgi:hypothetical protein